MSVNERRREGCESGGEQITLEAELCANSSKRSWRRNRVRSYSAEQQQRRRGQREEELITRRDTMASLNSSYCPILQEMLSHSLHNHTEVNLAEVLLLAVVSAVGILENALILWVVGFRVRHTVSAVWVINLALSDLLATLTLPLFVLYLAFSHSWELGQPLCAAQSAVFFLNMFVSAFLLAAISLDRCLMVARPVWSQNHRSVPAAWLICGLGWLWAALNSLPYFLFRSVIPRKDGRNMCYHNFALYPTGAGLDRDCRLRQEATAISKFLLAFLVPLAVIAGSYAWFGWSLRERARRRGSGRMLRSSSSSSTGAASLGPISRQFSRMVVSVIAAFGLCWSPYHAFCLLEMTAHSWPRGVKMVVVGLPLATFFSFLNPVLNPVLYAFSCPDFCVRIRQSLAALLEGLLEEDSRGRCSIGSTKGKKRRDTPSPHASHLLFSKASMASYQFKHCQSTSRDSEDR
ncbi:prostaglandin D2 receptor 2-like [Megalops cyprinoides]|uniref:prostaglandin D2 receptor 2-like n=1 Tax=Megalops cyprinoides TaxID=118141 RepID=UPI001864A5A9|nr:prostaglandin D2 receptor 2-like [Megalops cyprinoides]